MSQPPPPLDRSGPGKFFVSTDKLGEQFDINELHDVILGNGPMPVGFLEWVVDEWIQSKPGQ